MATLLGGEAVQQSSSRESTPSLPAEDASEHIAPTEVAVREYHEQPPERMKVAAMQEEQLLEEDSAPQPKPPKLAKRPKKPKKASKSTKRQRRQERLANSGQIPQEMFWQMQCTPAYPGLPQYGLPMRYFEDSAMAHMQAQAAFDFPSADMPNGLPELAAQQNGHNPFVAPNGHVWGSSVNEGHNLHSEESHQIQQSATPTGLKPGYLAARQYGQTNNVDQPMRQLQTPHLNAPDFSEAHPLQPPRQLLEDQTIMRGQQGVEDQIIMRGQQGLPLPDIHPQHHTRPQGPQFQFQATNPAPYPDMVSCLAHQQTRADPGEYPADPRLRPMQPTWQPDRPWQDEGSNLNEQVARSSRRKMAHYPQRNGLPQENVLKPEGWVPRNDVFIKQEAVPQDGFQEDRVQSGPLGPQAIRFPENQPPSGIFPQNGNGQMLPTHEHLMARPHPRGTIATAWTHNQSIHNPHPLHHPFH